MSKREEKPKDVSLDIDLLDHERDSRKWKELDDIGNSLVNSFVIWDNKDIDWNRVILEQQNIS